MEVQIKKNDQENETKDDEFQWDKDSNKEKSSRRETKDDEIQCVEQ